MSGATRWQDLRLQVSTDEGARPATRFFVNGEEPTRRIITEGGYPIQGTLAHRIKVVDAETGQLGLEAARRPRARRPGADAAGHAGGRAAPGAAAGAGPGVLRR